MRIDPLGVYYDLGRWQLWQGNMMIGHQNIQAHLVGLLDFGESRYAGIDSDYQAHALLAQFFQRRNFQPVALVLTVRDIGHDIPAHLCQSLYQQSGGCDTVSIEIAVYSYFFPGHERFIHAIDGLVHIWKGEWVYAKAFIGLKENFRF